MTLRTFTLLVGLVVGMSAGATCAAAARPLVPVTCDERSVGVGSGVHVAGTYCRPAGGSAAAAIVMVPGGGYARAYWDFPYQPATYSFARAAARAGYAAFAIDRLGTGESTIPLSAALTATRQAVAVHQVVSRLRGEGLDGVPFERVLLAGHSLGTGVIIIEAGTFHDVDGVVLTGWSHRIDALKVADLFATDLYPAPLDPALTHRGFDVGYLATKPGHRYEAVHHPGQVDPQVIDTDEATKDVFSVTEAADGVGLASAAPYSALIDTPVLVANGEHDEFFCGLASDCSSASTLLAQERPLYASARCVDAVVMPGAGHSINLDPSAPELQERVLLWADAVIGGECPNGS